MRLPIGMVLVAAALVPGLALPAALPVSGTYGNNDACTLFTIGGAEAVTSGGVSVGDTDFVTGAADFMLVRPQAMLGLGWSCKPAEVVGPTAVLQCDGRDGPSEKRVSLKERNIDATLAVSGDLGSETLRLCRQ